MSESPELMRVLGRIEGKLDAVQAQFSAHIITDEKTFHEHDHRLNKVERKQSWFMGGLAVVTVGFAAAWQWLLRGV